MSLPDRASSTWPSSSTPLLGVPSVGGQAELPMRALCSMPSTRRFMIGGLYIAAGWFTIPTAPTAARNMCPFAIPRDWRRRASSRLSGGSANPTTTLSPKRSTGFTRPRSSIGEDRDEASKPWSLQRWNGSAGSTTDASWSPSATYRQPRPKNDTTPYWTRQHWPHNLNQMVSGKPGAVHYSNGLC